MLTLRIPDWALYVAACVCAVAAFSVQQHELARALRGAHPIGDYAIFELNVRLALEGIQKLGPYSQGFHHPGPAYFYVLAIPYALMDRSSYALYFGAYVLLAAFVTGSSIGVCRWTRSPLTVVAFALLLVLEVSYLGDFPLFDFWPPYVLFMGFGLLIILSAGLASGRTWVLGLLVGLATFLVQTHIGYALPVLGVVAVTVEYLRRRRLVAATWRLHVALAAVIAAAMWAPPIYAEVFERAGNLGKIYRTFTAGTSGVWTLRSLLDRIALEFTGPLQFALFGDRFTVPEAPKHFLAARVLFVGEVWALAWGFVRARRRRDAFLEALCATCLVSLPVALLTLGGIPGKPAPHHTAWVSVLGMVSGAAACGGLMPSRWLQKVQARRSMRTFILAALLGGYSIVHSIAIISGNHLNPEVGWLASAIAALERDTPDRPVMIDSKEGGPHADQRIPAFELAVGIMLELEKGGFSFSARQRRALKWAVGSAQWDRSSNDAQLAIVTAGIDSFGGRRLRCVEQGDDFFLSYPVCVWLAK